MDVFFLFVHETDSPKLIQAEGGLRVLPIFLQYFVKCKKKNLKNSDYTRYLALFSEEGVG